jgi:hypothetical protein
MTETQTPTRPTPVSHAARDWLCLELALPSGSQLLDHLLDRIEQAERAR